MRTRSVTVAMSIVVALVLAPAAQAAMTPVDYSQVARNIIPSGQQGSVPIPAGADHPGADVQRAHAAGRTTSAPPTCSATSSPSSSVWAPTAPARSSRFPFPGVTIIRDRFDVPHVTATTHDGGVWAAGWIAAEDRGLLLAGGTRQLASGRDRRARAERHRADREPPGLQPSAQTERVVARQTQVAAERRPRGPRRAARHRRVRHRDQRLPGGRQPSTSAPFTRNDVYALNALKDQFFGEGGGHEAQHRSSSPRLEHRLGVKQGLQRLQRPAPEPERRQPDDRRRERSPTSRRRASPVRPAASC